ncbi:MAG: hypothetical protein ACK4NE_03820 [Albidovulum sp.]
MAAAPLPSGPIEIRVTRIEQLFESLDPAPFHERDLDRAASDYIAGWARDLSEGADFRILIHLPQAEALRPEAALIADAVSRHFGYLALTEQRALRELFQVGRYYLAIGLVILGVCLFGSQLVRTHLGEGPLAGVLRESLIILGWVANWKPLETVLYDWWPIRRRLTLLRRLAAAPVEIGS